VTNRRAGSRRALVTGGAGFIGSHVTERLLERGYDVVVVDNLSTGKRSNVPTGAHFVECDIGSDEFRGQFRTDPPDIVAHLAAQIDVRKSIEDPVTDAETNILSLIRMMEAVISGAPNCRIVLTSTAGVYGDAPNPPLGEGVTLAPLSPYAISKAAAERYLDAYMRIHGIKSVILRFANVYGPRQDPKGEAGVVSIFCSRLRSGTPLTVYGDGKQTRDYVFVGDVADAIVKAAEIPIADTSGGAPIFNIGTGNPTSVLSLVASIEKIAGTRARVEFQPLRAGEIIDSSLDSSLARAVLGWTPGTGLYEGLETTFASEASHR
jgi:UDP-glucose 4-epimerase